MHAPVVVLVRSYDARKRAFSQPTKYNVQVDDGSNMVRLTGFFFAQINCKRGCTGYARHCNKKKIGTVH